MGYDIRMRQGRNTIECCRTCRPESEGGKRYPGCHGTCEDYIAEKKKYEDEKAMITKVKAKENEHANYVKNTVARKKRAHR